MNRPVRRSQAISPFGIGALVDFPGPVSLVHAGLDAWPFDENKDTHREFKVQDEPRLARRLGVDFFVQPPDFRKANRGESSELPNLYLQLPFLRFPLWHACSLCGRMYETRYQDRAAPVCEGPFGNAKEKNSSHKPRKTVQVRFIAACRDGHMRDFPWIEWLGLEKKEWGGKRIDRWLRLLSTGSASAAGIVVVAERRTSAGIETVKRRTMSGALGSDMGIACNGQNPVLGIGDGGDAPEEECTQPLQAVLRGSSNLYFGDVRSAIYVPDFSDQSLPQEVLDLLDDHDLKQDILMAAMQSDSGLLTQKSVGLALKRRYPESSVDPQIFADAANRLVLHEALTQQRLVAQLLVQKAGTAEDGRITAAMISEVIEASDAAGWAIDPSLLVGQLNNWVNARGGAEIGESTLDISERAFRADEYAAFSRDGQEGMPKVNLLVRSFPIGDYESNISNRFSRIALLDKLRETRAFVGFSRLYPTSSPNSANRWKLISRTKKNWLPAVVVRGEGIFLEFDNDCLDSWDLAHGAFNRQRLAALNRNLQAQAQRRETTAQVVNPKFVLLHTFAHVLISQLIFDCGYGSSSLRERIYFSDEHPRMTGILIYTAAGDSEGTMGGLVRMGLPSLLERTVARALDRARWCSSDPVCIESQGQGPDNCNLAACHSCALLPETSCEQQNRLLDRGMLIGTLDRPETGFFTN
jgi:hypothetical protein